MLPGSEGTMLVPCDPRLMGACSLEPRTRISTLYPHVNIGVIYWKKKNATGVDFRNIYRLMYVNHTNTDLFKNKLVSEDHGRGIECSSC